MCAINVRIYTLALPSTNLAAAAYKRKPNEKVKVSILAPSGTLLQRPSLTCIECHRSRHRRRNLHSVTKPLTLACEGNFMYTNSRGALRDNRNVSLLMGSKYLAPTASNSILRTCPTRDTRSTRSASPRMTLSQVEPQVQTSSRARPRTPIATLLQRGQPPLHTMVLPCNNTGTPTRTHKRTNTPQHPVHPVYRSSSLRHSPWRDLPRDRPCRGNLLPYQIQGTKKPAPVMHYHPPRSLYGLYVKTAHEVTSCTHQPTMAYLSYFRNNPSRLTKEPIEDGTTSRPYLVYDTVEDSRPASVGCPGLEKLQRVLVDTTMYVATAGLARYSRQRRSHRA